MATKLNGEYKVKIHITRPSKYDLAILKNARVSQGYGLTVTESVLMYSTCSDTC